MLHGSLRTILVPLDGSELAERALGPARQLAAARGAALLLLQVVPARPPEDRAVQAALLEGAERYLAGVADQLRGHGTTVLVETCAGDPTRIVEQARLWRSDIVVMSTHGRGGLDRLVHGSIAGAVLHIS